ncbi:hypothetical protein COPCOM_00810 [Coprococcus comes ATCC 27758]|uniref:Uncharacterized protein n=1 Tax=Coprococcus comes ATCC 27758 TaxID=470146 RepID=C0B6N8_9FIRM|nr:hypothetical protein COPCOM_00810 [Coprococcus comes ATCC 27758]
MISSIFFLFLVSHCPIMRLRASRYQKEPYRTFQNVSNASDTSDIPAQMRFGIRILSGNRSLG